ncbi:MAG: hypothetical protein ACYSWP_04925, partial [Planctomycetota bacterium]
DLLAGDGPTDYFELNMTDNSYMSIGNCDNGFRHNEGQAYMDLSGNAILEAEYLRWRSKSPGLTCTIAVRENAQLIITDDHMQMAGG